MKTYQLVPLNKGLVGIRLREREDSWDCLPYYKDSIKAQCAAMVTRKGCIGALRLASLVTDLSGSFTPCEIESRILGLEALYWRQL